MKLLRGGEQGQGIGAENSENIVQQPRRKSKVKRENPFAWFVFVFVFRAAAHQGFRWGCDKAVKRHSFRPPPTLLSASCDRIVEYRIDNVSVTRRV